MAGGMRSRHVYMYTQYSTKALLLGCFAGESSQVLSQSDFWIRTFVGRVDTVFPHAVVLASNS